MYIALLLPVNITFLYGQNKPCLPIELNQGWEYRWGDSPLDETGLPLWIYQFSAEETWQTADNLNFSEAEVRNNFAWYRIRLPKENWINPTVYLPNVFFAFEAYLDTTRIYKFNEFRYSTDQKYAGVQNHLIPLPENFQGKMLFLRVFSDTPGYFGIDNDVQDVLAGPQLDLVKRVFLENLDSIVLGHLFIFVGLFSAFIFFRRIKERPVYTFSFGFFSFTIGLYYVLLDPASHILLDLPELTYYAGFFAFLLFPVGLYAFLEHIIGSNKLIRAIWGLHLTFALVAIVFDILNVVAIPLLFRDYFFFFILTILVSFVVGLRAGLRGNVEAKIFVAGFAILGITGLNDIFAGLRLIPHWTWLSQWGTLVFIIFLGYIVERRFRENHKRLQRYSKELEYKSRKLNKYSQVLEQKVAERTGDLNAKNQDLEKTLEQLKEMQHQLIMREKMAMLGNLVAGLAHEVNNPIGAVNSAADVSTRCIEKIDRVLNNSETIRDIKQNPDLKKSLQLLVQSNETIASAGKRVSKIVNSLKNFALLDEAEYKRVNLHEGIESTLTLLEYELKDRIKVLKEFGDIPEVYCYASQLNQVMLNILKNSSQAIDGEGIIRIKSFVKDKNIVVQISDTGRGIPQDKLEKIFDIGFSARGNRVKMGSGLWTAHNIMHQHGGELLVESDVGKGTSVSVVLPIK
jgi:signal transduction histidine kinase